MDLSLFFAGTGGSVPTARRGLPALLVRRGGERLLFDCGEGTQRQLLRSTGLADLDDVFLTHYHADHWLGLPGMLKTFDLRDRERPLTVHGPRGLRGLMDLVARAAGRTRYELFVDELGPGDVVERDGYEVAPFAVDHRDGAVGYEIREPERPGRFDAALAARLGVEPGPDFGRLAAGRPVGDVRPEQVVGPARPGRLVVLSGDTAPCEAVEEAARGADVLVHEATFTHEEAERAHETRHSTATQAAALAARAGVRMLALVHVSTRHTAHEIREEARETFPDTVVPRDFDSIEVPFPDQGPPRLRRFDDEPRAPGDAPGA